MADQDVSPTSSRTPAPHGTPPRRRGRPVERRQAAPLAIETLEERTVMSADPVVAISGMQANPLLGETIDFSIAFDNASPTDEGYSPYVEVRFPSSGADGDDGLSYVAGSATFLGAHLQEKILKFDENGQATHPFAVDSTGHRLIVSGDAGDTLVVFALPFGSFAADQPAAVIDLQAKLSAKADLGHDLTVSASGGFVLGNDPLDDPGVDPSIVGGSDSETIHPALFRLEKLYLGPENETATGENFPRQYKINVDVAEGQTLSGLKLTDLFPSNLAYLGVSYVTPGGSLVKAPPVGQAAAAPNNELSVYFPTVVGSASPVDLTMIVDFYVPRNAANSQPVLNPATGDDAISGNQALVTAEWTPFDVRDIDEAGPVALNPVGFEHVLTDKSIAVQKDVRVAVDTGSAGATPGDVLQHTLDFQISDFFTFDQLTLSDVFSDGQRLDTTYRPRLELLYHGTTYTGYFNADSTVTFSDPLPDDLLVDLSRIGNDADAATDGSTRLTFNLSQLLVNLGISGGELHGGQTNGLDFGPTQGRITYRTVIQDQYSDTYPSGRPRLDEADPLTSAVVIRGRVLDNSTGAPTGYYEEDDSQGNLSLAVGHFTTTIYAINGVVGADPKVAPGDTVTYRLTYTLTSGDFEQFVLQDYLPMPIFRAADADANDLPGPSWSYDTGNGTTPAAGMFQRGPSDTQFIRSGIVPTVAVDGVNNLLSFDYGTFEDADNLPVTIDLLFTVTATDDPFADQLLLTSQARKRSQNTAESVLVADQINQVLLTEPVLTITKGVVASDNANATYTAAAPGPVAFSPPGSSGPGFTGTIFSGGAGVTGGLRKHPMDANLRSIDAGDTVTFAIVIENTGSSRNGAYDVMLRDLLPAGFTIPQSGLNLRVVDGTGQALAYNVIGGGLFDPNGGIELVDGETGALASFSKTSGKNVAVILFDATIVSNVEPRQIVTNTATLFNYAGVEGGEDHTTRDRSDTAHVQVAIPAITKTVVNSEIVAPGNGVAQAVVGEVVTYKVTIQIPEGTTINGRVIDTMEPGLAFVDFLGFENSNPGQLSVAGSTSPSIQDAGKRLVWSLGDLVNANRDNSTPETITFYYRAVVTNVATNQEGETLDNSVRFTWRASSVGPVLGQQVAVVEPNVDLLVSGSANGGGTGDAGDPGTYEVWIKNADASTPSAYDVTFEATLPVDSNGSLILNPYVTVSDSSGLLSASDFVLTGDDVNGWTVRSKPGVSFDLVQGAGRVVKVLVHGTIADGVIPGQELTLDATARWSSLDGTPSAKSTYDTQSVERTGVDGVGGLNDYVDSGAGAVTVSEVQSVKQIAATSEASTGIVSGVEQVAIGEVVRYRLIARIPEGDAPNVRLVDLLPPGMQFLADGNVKVAFVSNGGIVSPTLSGSGLQQTGSSGSLSPTFSLPGLSIQQTARPEGTELVFLIGGLTNLDDDANGEYVVIEFNALVQNVAANQDGTTLVNTFTTHVDGSPDAPSNPVTVQVVEPQIVDLTKTATRPVEGGTVYQITFSNTGSSTAFDVALRDQLPDGTKLVPGSVTWSVAGGASGVQNVSPSEHLLGIVVAALPVGASVTLTYRVQTTGPAAVRENIATILYSSLPGTGTTNNPTGSNTPGTTGAPDGERGGSGSASNDYTDTASATTGYVGDEVWNDADHDGVRDNGEGAIAGATVELRGAGANGIYDDGDDVVATAVTDANGKYVIQGLPFGEYRVRVLDLSGLTSTYDLDDGTSSPDGQAYITIDASAPFTTAVDFGFAAPIVDPPEEPEPEVPPPVDPPAPPVEANFPFDLPPPNLPAFDAPGFVYANRESAPAAGVDTTGASAELPGLGLDLGSNEEAPLGGVSGSVFLDRNNNGRQDLDEPGLPGVAVRLDGPSVQHAYTDSAGKYSFEQLPPGVYTISEMQPDGLLSGRAAVGTSGGAAGDDVFDAVGLKPGDKAKDYHFAELESGSISGTAFYDADADGIRDPEEPAVPGVAVHLRGVDDRGRDVAMAARTDANGNYSFDGLRPGEYETIQAELAWSLLGDAGRRAGVSLASGGRIDGQDFAESEHAAGSPVDSIASQAADSVLSAYDRWIGSPLQLARGKKAEPGKQTAPAAPKRAANDDPDLKRAAKDPAEKRAELAAPPADLAAAEQAEGGGIGAFPDAAASAALILGSVAPLLAGPHWNRRPSHESASQAKPGASWDELLDQWAEGQGE